MAGDRLEDRAPRRRAALHARPGDAALREALRALSGRGCRLAGRLSSCSWRSRRSTAAGPGSIGSATLREREPPPWRRRAALADGIARTPSSSSCSSASGRRCAPTPTRAASSIIGDVPIFVAPRLAPTSGRGPTCSTSTTRAVPRSSPACRPTTSARRASSGATRSTLGRMARRGYAWWLRASAPPCARSTWCASTTSAASRPTGRCPPTQRRAIKGRWVPGPGKRAVRRRAARARRACPSSPRTSA